MRNFIIALCLLPTFTTAAACNFDSNQSELTRCAINEYVTARDMLERSIGIVEYCLNVDIVKPHQEYKRKLAVTCESKHQIDLGGSMYTQLFHMCMLEGTNKRISELYTRAPSCFKNR